MTLAEIELPVVQIIISADPKKNSSWETDIDETKFSSQMKISRNVFLYNDHLDNNFAISLCRRLLSRGGSYRGAAKQ